MNGTVAPPSSSSTAVATWWSRTLSSAAIRRITASAVAAGVPGAPESAAVWLVTIGCGLPAMRCAGCEPSGGALSAEPRLRAGGQAGLRAGGRAGLRAGGRAEPQLGPLADQLV